jgi:hypothetical protein
MTRPRTARATLNVPSDEVDLERWLFALSDADYQACDGGHRATASYIDEHGRGTINVESIGGNLIVQNYRAVRTDPSFCGDVLGAQSRVPAAPRTRHRVGAMDAHRDTGDGPDVGARLRRRPHLRPVLSMLGRLMASGSPARSSGGTSRRRPGASPGTSPASTTDREV